MAKFKITKAVDFGNFSIGDKNYGPACPSCMVPINNYAPKVGDIIEGILETKPISDGNGHIVVKTGITWPIRTNGSASTQGQTSIQFISEDHFEIYIPQNNNEQPTANPPSNTGGTNGADSSTNNVEESRCWICENKWTVIIGILFIIGLILLLNSDYHV